MNPLAERDMRQLNKVLRAIDAFLENLIDITALVGTLSFLHSHLDGVSEEWEERFWQQWGLLEMVNADSRDERRPLTEKEREYTQIVAKEIRLLVSNLLEQ